MASGRRLAKDHAALQRSLPPNYLFPHTSDPRTEAFPDDLTSLVIYLTGPTFTPYTSGLFLLHLRIPVTFPANPPTATFRTKIFHPNVDEKTGAVCLETLKRDWDPRLTLKDILVHISCLLVQPNPDSALNENAGVLVRDDYSAFERKARLMTKIHANIPAHYVDDARRARQDGEEGVERDGERATGTLPKEHGRVLDTKPQAVDSRGGRPSIGKGVSKDVSKGVMTATPLGPSGVTVLGKRTTTRDSTVSTEAVSLDISGMRRDGETGEPMRKSPKHKHEAEPSPEQIVLEKAVGDAEDKENGTYEKGDDGNGLGGGNKHVPASRNTRTSRPPFMRKVSNIKPGKLRPYARIGIRRL